jgi:hypothetical protein
LKIQKIQKSAPPSPEVQLTNKTEGRKSRYTVPLSKKKVGEFETSFAVNGTAETDFRDFRSDYLGKYEAICETVLYKI